MSADLIIRKCEPKDESAFVRLNLSFMHEVIAENPYWTFLKIPTEEEMKSIFREALSMPEKIMIFVSEVNGEVVAYANTWTDYSIWSGGMALTIDDLYVAPSCRRRGIGEKMMRYLIAYAKKNGYRRVQPRTELDNEKAHDLYRKVGLNEGTAKYFMVQMNS